MRRAVVFLAVGPVAVAAAWLAAVTRSGRVCQFELFLATMLFLFTLAGSILVGLFDGYFARTLSLFPRALLTSASGAIVIWGLANAAAFAVSGGGLPFRVFQGIAPIGAAYAGVCALLANDWAETRTAKT